MPAAGKDRVRALFALRPHFFWKQGLSCSRGYIIDFGNIINATSNHSGGANFGMADGSVKFIKGSILMKMYWGIGTKDDSEVISADSY